MRKNQRKSEKRRIPWTLIFFFGVFYVAMLGEPKKGKAGIEQEEHMDVVYRGGRTFFEFPEEETPGWQEEFPAEVITEPRLLKHQDFKSDSAEYLEVSKYLNVSTLTPGKAFRTKASWYGEDFHGKPRADGKRFDMYAIGAASRVLPLGTVVEVLCPKTGRSVTLKINDRGPYISGRDLDLSKGAAVELGMQEDGVADVVVRIISMPSQKKG